jgi:hypothetical protein
VFNRLRERQSQVKHVVGSDGLQQVLEAGCLDYATISTASPPYTHERVSSDSGSNQPTIPNQKNQSPSSPKTREAQMQQFVVDQRNKKQLGCIHSRALEEHHPVAKRSYSSVEAEKRRRKESFRYVQITTKKEKGQKRLENVSCRMCGGCCVRHGVCSSKIILVEFGVRSFVAVVSKKGKGRRQGSFFSWLNGQVRPFVLVC